MPLIPWSSLGAAAGREGIPAMSQHGEHDATLTLCRSTRGRVRILNTGDRPPATSEPNGPLGYNPVQHLAIALGCCMTEFARRFLERRNLPQTLLVTLDWQLDGGACRIARLELVLHLSVELDANERGVLLRLMDQCPVHQALHGNVPVAVQLGLLDEAQRQLAESEAEFVEN